MKSIFTNNEQLKNIYRLKSGKVVFVSATGDIVEKYESENAELVATLKAIEADETPATDEAKKEAYYLRRDLEREAENEKTEKENFQHCRAIADEIDAIVSGVVYRCPECGELYTADDIEDTEHEDEDGNTVYTCPHCKKDICEDDAKEEAVTLYDYFDDNMLDIDYITDGQKNYKSASICVAWGGPSIYVDTEKGAVCLYWWGENAQATLSSDAVAAVDEYAKELYNC